MFGAESKKTFSMDKFSALPILHEGRYKPLDSVARETLLSIYGKSTFKNGKGQKIAAIFWFGELLFQPFESQDYKLFLVDNPDVVNALGVKSIAARGHYSYNELIRDKGNFELLVKKALAIESKKRNRFEVHLLGLYQKVVLYFDIGRNVMEISDLESQKIWRNMAVAFTDRDQEAFDMAVDGYIVGLGNSVSDDILSKTDDEVLYNSIDPFFRSGLVVAVALFSCLCRFYFLSKLNTMISLCLCVFAFLLQTYGIYSRMVIMGRPPVTNLYSTFICTSWTCILIGVGIYSMLPQKFKKISPLAAAVSGLSFLIIAAKYNTGDSMGVMVAVLNSNFWLATHVTTIILGYAGCCFAGLFAHFYLISRITNTQYKELTQILYKLTISILAFGFSMTFIGTVLGGVWADQSWGRFWGWDPKENGALLIVLWCAAVFHAKVGGLVKKEWIAAGAIIGIQVVMLAWFGINKLGVGLHSYGNDPDSNAIQNLLILAVIELLFIAIVPIWGNKKLLFIKSKI